jgi:hypothetical protein
MRGMLVSPAPTTHGNQGDSRTFHAVHYITGSFHQTNLAQVELFVAGWLGRTQQRHRIFGTTWEVESATMKFHLETLDPQQAKYHLHVELEASREEATRWVERMTSALLAADILYDIGHRELGGQGEDIGEELTYAHPDFERRYVPPPP